MERSETGTLITRSISLHSNESNYSHREARLLNVTINVYYKHTFVATKDVFCHDKSMLVATKRIFI